MTTTFDKFRKEQGKNEEIAKIREIETSRERIKRLTRELKEIADEKYVKMKGGYIKGGYVKGKGYIRGEYVKGGYVKGGYAKGKYVTEKLVKEKGKYVKRRYVDWERAQEE